MADTMLTDQSSRQTYKKTHLKGNIIYSDRVIEKIIGKSLKSVSGLLAFSGGFFSDLKNKVVNSDDETEGVDVEVGTKRVAANLRIVVEYGKDIPDIVKQIKKVVQQEVAKMTHLDVIEVNVEVVDTRTLDEFEADSVTVQDRVTEAGKTTGKFVEEQAAKTKQTLSEPAETNESSSLQ
ncbi:Asp23/Gls24 family envelope stress response protein [Streptococcus sp. H31]|uniref:Asp23/Gls24 family envelope stress response protein n=1 Tax=Streptococcus huangxiaojuni TaxID=3237239 RepID=UPI0034A12F40